MTPCLTEAPQLQNSTGESMTSTTAADHGLQQFHSNECKCILHLFSGPSGCEDGFAAAVRDRGHKCVEYDLVNGTEQDLANDAVWQSLISDIRAGRYDAMLAGPPCNTYTNARQLDGLGPGPLRGATGDDRYGLPHLRPDDQIKVRTGTLLAVRTAEAATAMDEL